MKDQNFTLSILVDKSLKETFEAINNVRGWWSQAIEGDTDKRGAVFYYHYKGVHLCTFKITEFESEKKVVWHVLHNYFDFEKDKSEWTGTDVVFEIFRKGNQTQVRFTHAGLVPDFECFDVCSNAWTNYIASSLKNLIVSGKGEPNPKEDTSVTAH